MTPNKRIFLNIVATYGRSLFALVCGLFTSRWVIMSLGASDYGLFGLVGGLVGFVSFFNTVLSLAVGRFYAFEVGRSSVAVDQQNAVEQCRAWFSTAVFLHTVVPTLLLTIGWPIGEYAIAHWLTIPPGKLNTCLWVFRFSCISCFVGMVSVPFTAMYTAKQYIAELTIYSVATTAFRVIILYYMVTHAGEWLFFYGLMMALLAIIPNLIISVRAVYVFPECRLRIRELCSMVRIRQLAGYAGWELFGVGAWMSRASGLPILVNETLGAAYNSSIAVAMSVNEHVNSLSSSLTGAFAPAITNSYGAGNFELMRDYAIRACKIGTLLVMVFSIPILLEAETIVELWLKTPPPGTAALARYIIVSGMADRLSCGYHLAICASGDIGRYQMLTSIYIFAFLPLGFFLLCLGLDVHAIGLTFATTFAAHSFAKIWHASSVVGIPLIRWFRDVLKPLLMVIIPTMAMGLIVTMFFSQTISRVFISSVCALFVCVVLAYMKALSNKEREYVMFHARRVLGRIRRRS